MSESRGNVGIQFSLRDLLVLFTVAVIVIGLAAIWISSLIEPERSRFCLSNQRWLAIAVMNYEQAQRHLPGRRDWHDGKTYPWPVALLPYMEEDLLYRQLVTGMLPADELPSITDFDCPRDPTRTNGPSLSYVANGGIAELSNDNPANGVFLDYTATDNRQKLDDCIDGISWTIAFSENIQATQWNSTSPYETIMVWHSTQQPTDTMRINGGNLAAPVTAQSSRPSSGHKQNMFVVVYLDAHIQVVHQDIDYKVYMQLLTPDGANSDMPSEWRAYEVTIDDFD